MGKKTPSGSFDSAPPSAVSRDKSVGRSAQDDEFVGGLQYSWLYMQEARNSKKSQALRMTFCGELEMQKTSAFSCFTASN